MLSDDATLMPPQGDGDQAQPWIRASPVSQCTFPCNLGETPVPLAVNAGSVPGLLRLCT